MHIVRLIAVNLVLLMLLATWPHIFALERFPIFAQLTALRVLLFLTGLVGILGVGLLAWRAAEWRRWALAVSAGPVIVVAANVWIMMQRGIEAEVAPSGMADLTVFMWNA